MTRFEAPRGTHDILPSEQPLWQWVTGQMQDVCALYGYRRIVTPGFEETDLIIRTSGGGSDAGPRGWRPCSPCYSCRHVELQHRG